MRPHAQQAFTPRPRAPGAAVQPLARSCRFWAFRRALITPGARKGTLRGTSTVSCDTHRGTRRRQAVDRRSQCRVSVPCSPESPPLCALLLVAALLAPGGSASAAPTAGELSYACALKSNGLLRAVGSLSECKSNETKVTLKPGPHTVCIQPSGSTRLATKPKDCKAPATRSPLPPALRHRLLLRRPPLRHAALRHGPRPVPRRRGAGPGDAQRRRAQRHVHETLPTAPPTSPRTSARPSPSASP